MIVCIKVIPLLQRRKGIRGFSEAFYFYRVIHRDVSSSREDLTRSLSRQKKKERKEKNARGNKRILAQLFYYFVCTYNTILLPLLFIIYLQILRFYKCAKYRNNNV